MSEATARKTQVVTLRLPTELKARLDQQAKAQGVSVNNLANYLLTTQLSQLETLAAIERRLQKKSLPELKRNVEAILNKVPHKIPTHEWDRL